LGNGVGAIFREKLERKVRLARGFRPGDLILLCSDLFGISPKARILF
jgi:hypothetical protein